MNVENKDNRRNTMDSTNSTSSSTSTSSRTSIKIKSALVRLSGIFSRSTTSSTLLSSTPSNTFTTTTTTTTNRRSSSSSSNCSVNTSPSSVASLEITQGRKKKWIERDSAISDITIPPFSPTYCKQNEFPYSNFYMKLPNGKWMIRYRSGTRDIIGTDEFAGYMI